jgi:hypothetical protein
MSTTYFCKLEFYFEDSSTRIVYGFLLWSSVNIIHLHLVYFTFKIWVNIIICVIYCITLLKGVLMSIMYSFLKLINPVSLIVYSINSLLSSTWGMGYAGYLRRNLSETQFKVRTALLVQFLHRSFPRQHSRSMAKRH